jgi:hypothetical protein
MASEVLARLRRLLLGFAGIFVILAAALLGTCLPLIRGISCGHDFGFHLISWFEVQRSWSQGVLYPHWAQNPNWGAGEPRFVFYPPLTWMLGAVLGRFLPWDTVPLAMIFLSLSGAGLATWAFARRLLPPPNAALAGVLAAVTPYSLFTADERSAFGELAAAAWIPLLLLFALREPRLIARASQPLGGFSRALAGIWSVPPLSVTLAAIWLCNAPAGVMASYLLAFASLATALALRAWWPIVRAGAGAVFGLGLAAFYLLPAAWEQRWVAIRQALDVGMRVQDSWLFAHHLSPDMDLHDRVLQVASVLVVFTATFALLGLILARRNGTLSSATRHRWVPLALIVPCILLLQFPFSLPIWKLLPRLEFLQFPWRWLTVLGLPFALFLAAATPMQSKVARRWSMAGWALVVFITAAAGSMFFFQYCDEEDGVYSQQIAFAAGTGVEGTDEYTPAGADSSLIPSGLPDGCLVTDPTQNLGESDGDAAPIWYAEQGSCDEVYTASLWQTEDKRFTIDPDHAGYVVLRLSRYPAWQVLIDGKPATEPVPSRADGLLVIPVHAGPSTLEVRWTTAPDVLWGDLVSLASMLLLAGLWFAWRSASPQPDSATRVQLSSEECPSM